ncbi:matrin-3-like [Erpetoichthys calabaricus]|uniref:matrin-3-like n=1 Tax=Erpetoichthys calabaricus TaxID=27687 RepID=UPI00223438F2|nr:matrin-3-like [Erpetoichthys calabaricus]
MSQEASLEASETEDLSLLESTEMTTINPDGAHGSSHIESSDLEFSSDVGKQKSPSDSFPTTSHSAPESSGLDGANQISCEPRHGTPDKAASVFASLGLSSEDFDELAKIPEKNRSVEMISRILLQMKSQKGEMEQLSQRIREIHSPMQEKTHRGSRGKWEVKRSRTDNSDDSVGLRQSGRYSHYRPREKLSGSYERLVNDDRVRSSGRLPYSEQHRGYYRSEYDRLGSSSGQLWSKLEKRKGLPPSYKIEDYYGVLPGSFPHVCSICDCDIFLIKDWDWHIGGAGHAESCQILIDQYPDWLPSGIHEDLRLVSSTQLGSELVDSPPYRLQRRGVSSDWSSGKGKSNQGHKRKTRKYVADSRVVVAAFSKASCSITDLLELAKPYGTVTNHLELANEAFLEMLTHDEAKAMVDKYKLSPPTVGGNRIKIYLSTVLRTIEKQKPDHGTGHSVIYMCNLPSAKDMTSELMDLAKRFGPVKDSLILQHEAFLEMVNPADAEKMVKYYRFNPLKMKGYRIRLEICRKYKDLSSKTTFADDLENRKTRQQSNDSSSNQSKTVTKDEDSQKEESDTPKDEKENESDLISDTVDHESEGSEEEVVASGDLNEKVVKLDIVEELNKSTSHQSDESHKCQNLEYQQDIKNKPVEQVESAEVQEEPSDVLFQCSDNKTEGPTEECSETPEEMLTDPTTQDKNTTNNAETETSTASQIIEQMETNELEEKNLEESFYLEEEEELEADFPENLEDFVTLDEVGDVEAVETSRRESGISSKDLKSTKERRVVSVSHFVRKKNFEKEILKLAEPFGNVINYLILGYKKVAFLEMPSSEAARKMVEFYNTNSAMVCGETAKVHLSNTYKTMNNVGRVVYLKPLPPTRFLDKYILNLSKSFGKVRIYLILHARDEAFVEMESSDAAYRMANHYRDNPILFYGRKIRISLCKKYKKLTKGKRPSSHSSETEEHLDKEEIESSKGHRGPSKSKLKTKEKVGTSEKRTHSHESRSSQKVATEKEEGESEIKKLKMEEDDMKLEEHINEDPDQGIVCIMTEEEEGKLEEIILGNSNTSETCGSPKDSEANTEAVNKEVEDDKPDVGECANQEAESENSFSNSENVTTAKEEKKLNKDSLLQKSDSHVMTENITTNMCNTDSLEISVSHEKAMEDSLVVPKCERTVEMGNKPKHEPVGPYQPKNPVGVEFVTPKSGYFCELCNLFYLKEEVAKVTHCSSLTHYKKVKEHYNSEINE